MPGVVASGGNYGKARGLSEKKYCRGCWAQNWPPPRPWMGIPEWANAENAPGKLDSWAITCNEGIDNDLFCATYPFPQKIEASPPKK